jgi:integrase
MAGAGKYRSALAVMLFAGVRPDEVASQHKPALLWRHVNAAERMIRIPAEIAKTGRPRIMEGLPDAVWAWLKPAGEDQPVCPARSLQAVRLAQSLGGYGKKRRWPHDALRHTFATYHVAAFANPGQTAMLMGHEGNPTMLHRHYRGLATKAEAERFWALRPT